MLLELLSCRKWKASNSGGKPGKQTTNVWGEEVAVAVAALGLKVQKGGLLACCRSLARWSCSCERTGCRFLEAMLACVLLIFSSGLFVVGSLWVAFFRRPPTGTAGSGREPVVSSCTVGRVQAPGETNSVSLGPTHRIL